MQLQASSHASGLRRAQSGRHVCVRVQAVKDGATLDRPLRVAVIGGGPSGACAAETLAKGGVEVSLLERKMDNCKVRLATRPWGSEAARARGVVARSALCGSAARCRPARGGQPRCPRTHVPRARSPQLVGRNRPAPMPTMSASPRNGGQGFAAPA